METKQFRARALVVDDSRIDAAMLQGVLVGFGLIVDSCDDRQFPELMSGAYDLVFVDINMPSMDGFALANKIRHSELAIKEAPIVAVSGNHYDKEQVAQTLENGLDGYVEKPITVGIMEEILNEFLPHKEVELHNITKEGDIRLKGFFRKRKII